jgi:hypothetical protein
MVTTRFRDEQGSAGLSPTKGKLPSDIEVRWVSTFELVKYGTRNAIPLTRIFSPDDLIAAAALPSALEWAKLKILIELTTPLVSLISFFSTTDMYHPTSVRLSQILRALVLFSELKSQTDFAAVGRDVLCALDSILNQLEQNFLPELRGDVVVLSLCTLADPKAKNLLDFIDERTLKHYPEAGAWRSKHYKNVASVLAERMRSGRSSAS